jgi:hypothetical protein
MPLPTEELRKQSFNFLYFQWGGPRPNNPQSYAGLSGQIARLTGLSTPELGGVSPIQVRDPLRPGAYKSVGRTIDPPDLAAASLELMEKKGRSIPRALFKNCPFNLYIYSTECAAPGDVINGWDQYVHLIELALVTDKDLGDRVTTESDAVIVDTLSLVLGDVYPIGTIGLGEGAGTAVTVEVVDIAYGDAQTCGICGPENDGSQWIYALQKQDGYGLAPRIVYSTDGGQSWATSAITGATGTTTVSAIEVVGPTIIVTSPSANGYYWASINGLTGAPGAWTLVTTGFQSGGTPQDMFVLSPSEIVVVGNQGWVYLVGNVASGASTLRAGGGSEPNLARIHGDGLDTLVAVGVNATVLISSNRGRTWATATNAPGSDDLTAVQVLDGNRIWVGNDTGEVYYTLNRGETAWVEAAGIPSATAIQDIVFATQSVGYIAYTTAEGGTTGLLATTWNGGRDWAYSTNPAQQRLLGLPVNDRLNRIAVPESSDPAVNANNVALAGLGGAGYDGTVIVGAASRF